MKLNMGCGHNRLDGYINVDASAACAPDQVVDLETTPWPWADSSTREVVFNHSLEHMGAEPRVFLAIMSELYRICAADAVVEINVPHPRHDNFINDPTHVRAITPQTLALFDRSLNDAWREAGVANTPLAHYLGVDFRVTEARTVLDEPYATRLRQGEVTQAELQDELRARNNVAKEFRIRLLVRK